MDLTMALTILGAVLLGALNAYSARIQATTLWAGRAIVPASYETISPTGVQDAITPPWQTRLQLVWMIGLAVVVIVGSLQVWYFGILALAVALLASGIARALLPKRVAWYLHLIVNSLANREADYARDGDTMRAEAARELFYKVSLLLERVASANQHVPSMQEARSTPTGQLDE